MPQPFLRRVCVGWLCCALIVGVLTGCARVSRPSPTGELAARAQAVVFRALGLVGTPYRFGGDTPAAGFDCSGLVAFVFRDAAGIELPRSVDAMARLRLRAIERTELASGDLVFFGRPGRVSHVGIYVGEGRFVHAPASGDVVRIDRLDAPYWRQRWLYGRRVLR